MFSRAYNYDCNIIMIGYRPGTRLKDAYNTAVKTLKPELRDKLYKKELG